MSESKGDIPVQTAPNRPFLILGQASELFLFYRGRLMRRSATEKIPKIFETPLVVSQTAVFVAEDMIDCETLCEMSIRFCPPLRPEIVEVGKAAVKGPAVLGQVHNSKLYSNTGQLVIRVL